MTQKIPPLLTVADAARALDVDPARVRQLARSGVLAGEKRGRDWLFRPEAVEAAKARPRAKRTWQFKKICAECPLFQASQAGKEC